MKCTCGFENAEGARFCGRCGSPLGTQTGNGAANAVDRTSSPPAAGGSARERRSFHVLVAMVAAAAVAAAAGYWWLHRLPSRHKRDNSGLYRIKVDGKYGFMNRAGKTLIAPQFDDVYGFSEGLAAVKVGIKFGFINTKGEVVITPQFDLVFPFSEGLAAVQVGTKFGYINTKGLITITPQFDDVTSFHNGRAAVKLEGGRSWNGLDTKVGHVGNNRYGFIDKEGKYIGMPGLLFVQPDFRNETGWERDATLIRTADDRIGIMSGSGKVLVADKVDELGWDGFTDGLAPAATGGKWGYLNPNGEWVITPQFESVHGFEDGLAPVEVGQHWGLIDRTGKFVVNPQYDHVFGIAEGHAIVESGRGTIPGCPRYCANYGFISTKGQPVGNSTFVQHPNPNGSYSSPVRPFSEGLAAVKTRDGWGFIDPTGKMVIEPQFDSVGSFQDGLASVTILGKEAYITKTGSFVVDPFPGRAGIPTHPVQELWTGKPPDGILTYLQRFVLIREGNQIRGHSYYYLSLANHAIELKGKTAQDGSFDIADQSGTSWKGRFVSSMLIEGIQVNPPGASQKEFPMRLRLVRDATAEEVDPLPPTSSDWNVFLSNFRNAVQRRDSRALSLMMARSFSDNFLTRAQELARVNWHHVDAALARGVETSSTTPWGSARRAIMDEHPACPGCVYQVMLIFSQDRDSQWRWAGIGAPGD